MSLRLTKFFVFSLLYLGCCNTRVDGLSKVFTSQLAESAKTFYTCILCYIFWLFACNWFCVMNCYLIGFMIEFFLLHELHINAR